MLKKVSIILAFIVLIVNVHLSGEYFGFEQGYLYAVKTFTEIRGGHGTVYLFLREQYIQIAWGIGFFLIGKMIKKEILSHLLCIPSLIWIIYLYWQIYLQKSFSVVEDEPFNKMLRDSIPIDLVSFLFVFLLIVFEVFTFSKYLISKNRAISTDS